MGLKHVPPARAPISDRRTCVFPLYKKNIKFYTIKIDEVKEPLDPETDRLDEATVVRSNGALYTSPPYRGSKRTRYCGSTPGNTEHRGKKRTVATPMRRNKSAKSFRKTNFKGDRRINPQSASGIFCAPPHRPSGRRETGHRESRAAPDPTSTSTSTVASPSFLLSERAAQANTTLEQNRLLHSSPRRPGPFSVATLLSPLPFPIPPLSASSSSPFARTITTTTASRFPSGFPSACRISPPPASSPRRGGAPVRYARLLPPPAIPLCSLRFLGGGFWLWTLLLALGWEAGMVNFVGERGCSPWI